MKVGKLLDSFFVFYSPIHPPLPFPFYRKQQEEDYTKAIRTKVETFHDF